MKKVPWLMEHVKRGLQSFMLEISQQMMLHSWGDQLKLIAIKAKTLNENNQRYTMWNIADILKISKSSAENHGLKISLVLLIILMFGFHISSCIFPCKSLLKHSVFKTNCDRQWKLDTVQSCGMEEIVEQAKWTTTNHTKGWSSFKDDDAVYTVVLEGSPLLRTHSGKSND